MYSNKQCNLYGIAVTLEDVSLREPIAIRGSFERCCDIAAEIGYDGIELQMKDPRSLDAISMKKICNERGLRISALATGMECRYNGFNLTHDDRSVVKASIERMKEYVDLAEIWETLPIIGFMRGNMANPSDLKSRDMYCNRLKEALLEVLEYAEKKGVTLIMEAVNMYITNWMNTIRENTDFIRSIGSPNLLLHIDTHHMHIDERDMATAVEYCKDIIGYVHISDSNRLYPGGGTFDFKSFMSLVMSSGYDGFYTLEVLPVPSQLEAAKIGLKCIKTVEDSVRAVAYM